MIYTEIFLGPHLWSDRPDDRWERFLNIASKVADEYEKKYGIWLIGYDGGVKLFSKEISILKNIFSTIDSMPMRKNEMSSKTSKCN